jgi:hypothetical protein
MSAGESCDLFAICYLLFGASLRRVSENEHDLMQLRTTTGENENSYEKTSIYRRVATSFCRVIYVEKLASGTLCVHWFSSYG